MAKQQNYKIDRRHVGMSAINPFGSSNSSSRGYMTLSHIGSSLSLIKPEIPYALSGLEEELAKTTFGIVAPCDMIIINYHIVYNNTRNELMTEDDIYSVNLIYKDINKGNVINSILVKRFDNYDTKFGFEHRFTPLLSRILDGQDVGVIKQGTSFTMTNSEVEPGVYGYGLHAVVSTASHPDVAEDAITISTDLRERSGYYIYKTYDIAVKANTVPLNQYGDDENYLSLPKVGDKLEGGIIFATREINSGSYAALFNKKALKEVDVHHDTIYPLDKGVAEVIGITVIRNSRRNNEMMDGVYEQLADLADDFDTDASAFVGIANDLEKQCFVKKWDIDDVLHTDIVYFKKLDSPEIIRKEGRVDLPPYTIKIEVRYKRYPDVGAKVANRHGGKGVISNVTPSERMPVDENGLRADMIISDVSSTHRMNLGGEHEGYLSSVLTVIMEFVRKGLDKETNGKYHSVKAMLNDSKSVVDYYTDYVMGFIKLVSKSQYDRYSTFNTREKINLLMDIYEKGLYIYTPYDAPESKRDISEALCKSKYALKDGGLFYTNKDGEYIKTHATGHMKVQYIMVLNKIADDWLAVNAANMNHLGLPVPPSKESKKRYPFNFRPVKSHSETETRFIAFYCGVETLAELRDRNLSLDTFNHIYNTLLSAKNPFAISNMVNRKHFPFGKESSVLVMDTLLASAGLEISTIED